MLWHVLCSIGFVVTSLCASEIEYEGNYSDIYDNEISQDEQEGERPTPCKAPDFSSWDKLFIALEDSQMRQNILLESQERCCGGMVHLRSQVEKLASSTCQQCVHSVESAFRAQAEQMHLRLQRELKELREEEAERETRLNATLQMLLRSNHEVNAKLKRLEGRLEPAGAADSRMRHQPTPTPGGVGGTFSLGVKPFPPGLKEREVTPPLDMTSTIEGALVAIATELEAVRLQLRRVTEQGGTLDRGDT